MLVSALFLMATEKAFAEKRVALVIGNSAYQSVAQLTNPANDAVVINDLFKKANFDVVESRRDLTNVEMRRTLRDFTEKSRDADIAIVYYAGHGVEVDGTNYLIPVDAALQRDTDVYDEAISLDRILQAIEPAKQLRLVILDACRDNPFGKVMKRTLVSRSVGRGLTGVEPTKPNTLVAFAAKGGSTAFDGDNKNSPFTLALVHHLTVPGLDLRKAFGLIRDEVMNATGDKQEPFVYGSLGGTDVVLVPEVKAPSAPGVATMDTNAESRRDYEFAVQVGTKEAWDSFLAVYSTGYYANLARAQQKKLAAEETRLAATEKARLAVEQQAKLDATGAGAAEKARAAAELRLAEGAKLIAEKKKQTEQANLAALETSEKESEAKVVKSTIDSAATTTNDNTEIMDTKLLREIRERLYDLNFDPGPVEGGQPELTRTAIAQFLSKARLPAQEHPTLGLLNALRAMGSLKPWGAVAYEPGTNRWGMSWDEMSRKDAIARASASCGNQPKSCPIVISFFETGCAAFAHSTKGWAIVARGSVSQARADAVEQCSKKGPECGIIASVCADGTERFSAK
jgi:uncharacterized caspase-like protein